MFRMRIIILVYTTLMPSKITLKNKYHLLNNVCYHCQMIAYLGYALTICHNSYRNEPSYNCPTTVLVRIRQAAIINKPYNFSGLTQWKSISSLLRFLQESSAMPDPCSSPISYQVLLHVPVLLKKKWRTHSHFSKALVRNDTITSTNSTSTALTKTYSFNHMQLQGLSEMKTGIVVPKQEENGYLSEQKQHSLSFHILS